MYGPGRVAARVLEKLEMSDYEGMSPAEADALALRQFEEHVGSFAFDMIAQLFREKLTKPSHIGRTLNFCAEELGIVGRPAHALLRRDHLALYREFMTTQGIVTDEHGFHVSRPFVAFEYFGLGAIERCGLIPDMLRTDDPRPAREQFDAAYAHGGGWLPFRGFKFNAKNQSITYPGDPSLRPLARGKLRDETILIYPNAWVGILQPNGDFEVARMD